MKSRLSTIAAVITLRLTSDPERGRQGHAGVGLVMLSGLVAEALEGVAALDGGEPLLNQSLELDGAHLRAVLLLLALALALLVVIELTLHAVGLAVKEVGERPQHVGKIVLEGGVGERLDERGEDTLEHGVKGFDLRERARIELLQRLALLGAPCVGGRESRNLGHHLEEVPG
jgi:hypothetical protein